MELSLVLSILAIVLSIVTLWLTEFRGPDISLLTNPKYELNDESFDKVGIREYTPRWFPLEDVLLVFANYGGKTGTIVDLELDFVPSNSFRRFYDTFSSRRIAFEGDVTVPVTIEDGDNQHLTFSPQIRTIDWKKATLAEALNPNLKIDDIVEIGFERSKEKFKSFCDVLGISSELGRVSCTIKLTKGRFRTMVTEERIIKDVPLLNKLDKTVSSLGNCVDHWEDLKPAKAELSNEITRDFEGIVAELKGNSMVSAHRFNVHEPQSCKLSIDRWNTLQRAKESRERKIRWFLIDSHEGLREALTTLYESIAEYNHLIDELISLGDFGSRRRVKRVDTERKRIQPEIEKLWSELSSLLRGFIA